MNEVDDVNQKISALKGNREMRTDDNMLDRKISVNVKTLLSSVLIVVIVAGAFLMGRYVFPSGTPLVDNIASAAVTADSSSSEETALTDSNTQVTDESPAVEAESSAPAETADDAAAENASEVEEDNAADAVETVITEGYDNVIIEFTRTPAFEWKGTWGKITTIYYTITNNEAGTIKPDKFRVIAEGYETADFIKTVDVPTIDRTIRSGAITKHGVDVKLQYSESVTDPADLQLTLQLLDKDGNLIDATNQLFNLKE